VFVVSLLTAEVLTVTLFIARASSLDEALATLTTLEGLIGVAYITLFNVLPIGVPPALVGSWLAARVLARERGRPWTLWARRGSATGAGLGGGWIIIWFALMALQITEPVDDSLAEALLIGAAAGTIAGAVVGLVAGTFCWRVARA
jgi:hypothetical protein